MSFPNTFEFCNKLVGPGLPAFVIAEVGFNHNGDVELAKQLITAAKENGADAVKLQTWNAKDFYSTQFLAKDPDQPNQTIEFYKFFQRYELSKEDYKVLFDFSKQINIPLFSTPFDDASLDMLVEMGMPAIKIASGDLTHHQFIKYASSKGLPIVLSTGMGNLEEIAAALEIIQKGSNPQIVLMHCVSNYPAKHEEMNLSCIPHLSSKFNAPVGLSDHTLDLLASTIACSLGAVMIEKHFTLNRDLPGADQKISMEPWDLKRLKQITQSVNMALGDSEKKAQASEEPVKLGARRSVVAKVKIDSGSVITLDMLTAKRPGTGISVIDIQQVAGRKAKVAIQEDQILTWDMVT